MASRPTEDVLLLRPCRYVLPDDLRFEGLVPPQGTETVRIRFSRKRETTLEIPLSAEALALLVRCLGPLHGIPADEIAEELERLRRNVGFLD